MAFKTMFAYMANYKCYIPHDKGDCRVQPDLSLSPKEIMERWVRNMPLDVITRNGSYYIESDSKIAEDDFDLQDTDIMDLVDAEEYLATRNLPKPSERPSAKSSEPAKRSEQDGADAASEAAG